MELRRWLPYRRLHNPRLGLALATARVIAWLGLALVAAGVAWGLAATITHAQGSSIALVLGVVVGLVGYGLVALTLSGVLAAVVGIEAAQRRASEADE